MIDESGTNYTPPKIEFTGEVSAPPTAAPSPPPPAIPIKVLRRPFWIHLTVFYLTFLFFSRICGVISENPVAILVQMASASVIAVIILGLLGLRRWGAWLFIIYCIWSVISTMIVGIYRIQVMPDLLADQANFPMMIMSQIMSMGMSMAFYGLLAIGYATQVKKFIPSSQSLSIRGNISVMMLVGFLILHTATQISDSRTIIELQEDTLEQMQGQMGQWLRP